MERDVVKSYLVNALPGTAAAGGSAAGVTATRWFAPAWTMLPLASRRCLVRNPLNGAAAELSSGEYAVLCACEGCRTLDEHEARAAQQLSAPPEHRSAIRELLERCARRGLLLSLADLAARFGASSGSAQPSPEIVIRSADRPQLLRRLLAGAARVQERTGAAYRWHILDDSRSEDHRRANREANASVSALDVTYHDLSLADSLEAELLAAFPELASEIRSLLQAGRDGEYTCARPLHYVLLRFAGRRFLHLDDDVLIEPRQPPLSRPGVETTCAPEAAHWYEGFDAAFAACPELPLDPFAAHARWLGMPLADAWQQAEREPGGHRVGELPPQLGSRFAPQARVVFTGTHVLGDPGWGTFSGQQLAVGRETREWLAAHPEASRYAFASQVHWRGWPALQLAPEHVLSMTTLSGIDDSVLIAPALRLARATDTIVSEVTRAIHPAAWGVVVPFALPHVREARRKWLTPADAYLLRPSRLIVSYARRCSASLRADDPAQRLAMLGSMFVDLGGASDATVTGLFEELAADSASRLLFSMHEQLDDAMLPAAWKDTLREWLTSPMFKLDAASVRQRIGPLDTVRSVARDYGKALIAWPKLWEHCRGRFR
ncbi:MAG TPA: hypothetical protein VF814_01485 [Casimicrobiaceae bacterium]